MTTSDKAIISELAQYLANGLDGVVAGVFTKTPAASEPRPYLVIKRMNATDLSTFFKHLDLLLEFVTDDPAYLEQVGASEKVGEVVDEWFDSTKLDICSAPLLNSANDSDDVDAEANVALDFQLDYLP